MGLEGKLTHALLKYWHEMVGKASLHLTKRALCKRHRLVANLATILPYERQIEWKGDGK